jgi:3-hydroxyisobutyrate dehydrogenase-like beta-hydroxyacid dehydrogenase
MTTAIGFIGLGTMGAPMARNVLKGGYPVTVWSRRQDAMAPLVKAGAAAGSSPADVAAKSDIIVTMVTDTAAVEEVILGEHGIARGARQGSIVIVTARSIRTAQDGSPLSFRREASRCSMRPCLAAASPRRRERW